MICEFVALGPSLTVGDYTPGRVNRHFLETPSGRNPSILRVGYPASTRETS